MENDQNVSVISALSGVRGGSADGLRTKVMEEKGDLSVAVRSADKSKGKEGRNVRSCVISGQK
ncbi:MULTISPECIES: hypothetical protein [Bacillaceae]|uniref:Uncharacterized protein n=1 Tax=Evansella alkalicola TaxID=745819 RepID=A0ABS6JPU4_9BACI|nr:MULTISPECIES: hypothetical protein [Bacillaceae]MBU9720572.1 hypothetical protein [Bacillus alkalicola]